MEKNEKNSKYTKKVHFWHLFCSQIAILHQKVVITFQNRTFKRNSSGVKRCAARIYSTLYITSKTGVSSKIEIWAKYSRKVHFWHLFCSRIAILHQKVTITLQSRTFKKNRSGVKRSAARISSTSYITSETCVSSKIEKIAKYRRKVHFLPFLAVKWHFLTKNDHNSSKSNFHGKSFGSEKIRRTILYNFVDYVNTDCLMKIRDSGAE